MPTEILVPNGDITVSSDWTKTGGGLATYTEIDEGASHDSDTSYVENLVIVPLNGNTFEFALTNPVGTPNYGSGAASWTLRMWARSTGIAGGDLDISVYQGGTLKQGPYTHTLTTSYAQYTVLFDPAAINDANDLRIRFAGNAGATFVPRVTATTLTIQQMVSPPNGLLLLGVGG